MPKIRLVARGSPNDHSFWSPRLTEEEAARQLGEIHNSMSGARSFLTDWCSVRGSAIVGAQLVADGSGPGMG